MAHLRVSVSPLPGGICLLRGLSPPTQWWVAEWGVGSTVGCFLSTSFGLLQGLRSIQSTHKAPSAMTQIPQGSQGQGLACVPILKGFPPSPSQKLPPGLQKTKTQRIWSEQNVHSWTSFIGGSGAPRSPACLLRPASCSHAHRSRLRWWRSERNSGTEGINAGIPG